MTASDNGNKNVCHALCYAATLGSRKRKANILEVNCNELLELSNV